MRPILLHPVPSPRPRVPVSPRRLLLLCLLLPLPAWAQVTYHTRQAATTRLGRTLAKGSDSHTCAQARAPATPKASINGGIACLTAGDTLQIGPGTYDELLTSQQGSGRECSSSDQQAQPGCATIPNGLDADRPTRLVGDGHPIVSPRGRQWPGGGKVINVYDAARYLHIAGLRIVKADVAGSVGGIYLGNPQSIALVGNELDDGEIKSGVTSRDLYIADNYIHHTGQGCVPPGQKPQPTVCPHGMYLCGTDHLITRNRVEYGSYYGIQVSCEQGGIARIRVEANILRYNAGVGIRCQGDGCAVVSNLLVGNGQGITLGGNGVVANNTIHGYTPAPWNDDPFGILAPGGSWGSYQIVDNILTDQKSAFYTIANQNTYTAPDPQYVHHNLCSESGNAGCPLAGTAAQVYTNAAQGDFTLQPGSPARQAGVTVASVTTDVQGNAYPSPPDVGAYSSSTPPIPPEPPATGLVLACEGRVESVPGKVIMQCTPPQEERR